MIWNTRQEQHYNISIQSRRFCDKCIIGCNQLSCYVCIILLIDGLFYKILFLVRKKKSQGKCISGIVRLSIWFRFVEKNMEIQEQKKFTNVCYFPVLSDIQIINIQIQSSESASLLVWIAAAIAKLVNIISIYGASRCNYYDHLAVYLWLHHNFRGSVNSCRLILLKLNNWLVVSVLRHIILQASLELIPKKFRYFAIT